MPLLAPHEPAPLETYNIAGGSDFVLICEHAGRRIPESLGDLGLPETELTRHIAWDIGARGIAMALADRLDAPLFMQRYSRLICDCNRRPDVPSFVPVISESTEIPANRDLPPEALAARIREVFDPFHDAISAFLDARQNRRTILASIHSFTPVYKGESRIWEVGVLYHRDRILSPAMLEILRRDTAYTVGDNQPYSVGDLTDYAIPVHGEARGLPCVEIEIRNDLTEGVEAIAHWSALLASSLSEAAGRLAVENPAAR